MRITTAAALAALCIATTSAQIRNPLGRRLPVPKDLPGIGRFLDNPPLTTTGADAWLEAPPLDGWAPATFEPLEARPRDKDGRFVLKPGAYALDAESYCLHIAARGPVTGEGFLNAPLKGPRAGVVRSILKNAAAHPEIAQRDIQVLLWSLLARVEVNELNPKIQGIAAQLLTPQELNSVSDSPWDLLDTPAGRRAVRELPQPVQRALSAERRMRDLVRKGNYKYEQLERIAMTPAVVMPNDAPRDVPRGRWMHHPNGFFVRYASNGYRRTRVEIAVPDRYTYGRDRLGRITSLTDSRGNRIETDYDDTRRPLTVPDDPRTVGYAFKSIRFIRGAPNGPERHEIRDRGWTLVRVRRNARRAALVTPWPWAPVLMRASSRLFQDPAGRFDRWRERYEGAREVHDRYEYYRERADRAASDPDESAIDDLENDEHYRDGVDAAVRGDRGEQLDWVVQQQERQRDALRHAIVVIDTLPTTSTTDEPAYGPWDDAAIPTRSGSQRLGISGR